MNKRRITKYEYDRLPQEEKDKFRETTEYLDESFNPGYGEDIDFCYKAKKAGYTVEQVPNDITLTDFRTDHTLQFPIWHKGSVTVHDVPEWDSVVPRNEALLLERWGEQPERVKFLDIKNQLDTISSNQLTQTIDSLSRRVDDNGVIKATINDRTTLTLIKSGYIHGIFPGKDHLLEAKRINSVRIDPSLEGIKDHILNCGSKGIEQFGGLWEGGYCTQQNPDELAAFLYDIKGKRIENYLEIGVAEGGVTRLLCDIADVGNVVHIDMGWGDQNHPFTYRHNIENLRNTGTIDIFRGDSHSEECETFLGDRKFDCIFIDGDHSYDGVVKDTELALKHANKGCLFIYHDHLAVEEIGKWNKELKALGKVQQITHIKDYESTDNTKKGISVFQYYKPTIFENKPKISIVIPTYQHLSDCLIPCIESIVKHTNLENVEIIVVANGCSKDTSEYLFTEGHSKMIWIDEPVGFVKAVNRGLLQATGDYIIVLNNDTIVTDNTWIDKLLAPFADPTVGITGPYKDIRFFWDNGQLIFREDYIVFYCCMLRKSMLEETAIYEEI